MNLLQGGNSLLEFLPWRGLARRQPQCAPRSWWPTRRERAPAARWRARRVAQAAIARPSSPRASSSSGACAANTGEWLRAATWLTLIGLAATGAAYWYVNSGEAADALLRTLVEYAEFPGPFTFLSLELGGLTEESGRQYSLFTEQTRRREQLDEMVRHLKVRFGESPLARVVEVEPWHRLPERRRALLEYDP